MKYCCQRTIQCETSWTLGSGPSVHLLTCAHLIHFGAVFKGARVVDVIHQTDDITGQVLVRQELKIWHHLMELLVSRQETESITFMFC